MPPKGCAFHTYTLNLEIRRKLKRWNKAQWVLFKHVRMTGNNENHALQFIFLLLCTLSFHFSLLFFVLLAKYWAQTLQEVPLLSLCHDLVFISPFDPRGLPLHLREQKVIETYPFFMGVAIKAFAISWIIKQINNHIKYISINLCCIKCINKLSKRD